MVYPKSTQHSCTLTIIELSLIAGKNGLYEERSGLACLMLGALFIYDRILTVEPPKI